MLSHDFCCSEIHPQNSKRHTDSELARVAAVANISPVAAWDSTLVERWNAVVSHFTSKGEIQSVSVFFDLTGNLKSGTYMFFSISIDNIYKATIY